MTAGLLIGISPGLLSQPVFFTDFDREDEGTRIPGFIPVTGHWEVIGEMDKGSGSRVLCSRGRRFHKANDVAERFMLKVFTRINPYRSFYREIITGKINLAYCSPAKEFREGFITTGILIRNRGMVKAGGVAFNGTGDREFYAVILDANRSDVLLLYINGQDRKVIMRERGVKAAAGSWHRLRVVTRGRTVHGYLDDRLCVKYDFDSAMSGRTGLVSLGETEALFDDFMVRGFIEAAEKDQKRISPRLPRINIFVP